MSNSNQNQNPNQKKIFTLNASSEQEGFSISPIVDDQIFEYFTYQIYSLCKSNCHFFAQNLIKNEIDDLYFVEYAVVNDGGAQAVLFIPQSSTIDGGFEFCCPNYFQGVLDDLSAGIVLTLYVYSHLSMEFHPSNISEKVSNMFHLVRNMVLSFDDSVIQSKIFRAID